MYSVFARSFAFLCHKARSLRSLTCTPISSIPHMTKVAIIVVTKLMHFVNPLPLSATGKVNR